MSEITDRIAKRKKKQSGNRWACLNTFVDMSMKKLTTAQSAVWTYMFRHERNGTVDTTYRQIAEGTGLSNKGAHTALHKLIDLGYVEVLKLSKSHGQASVYRLHPKA